MGDKSPKSTRKKSNQRQVKANKVKRKKKDAEEAKRTAFPRK